MPHSYIASHSLAYPNTYTYTHTCEHCVRQEFLWHWLNGGQRMWGLCIWWRYRGNWPAIPASQLDDWLDCIPCRTPLEYRTWITKIIKQLPYHPRVPVRHLKPLSHNTRPICRSVISHPLARLRSSRGGDGENEQSAPPLEACRSFFLFSFFLL